MKKENLFYNGNGNLRGAEIEIDYTPEQIVEIIRCKDDPIYFIRKYVMIVSLRDGLIPFDLYGYQENFVNTIHHNNRVIAKWPRQSGKSTTTAAYIVHYVLFNSHKEVAILANKESTAQEILSRVQLIYENLPIWLQAGVSEWNKRSFELDNGCSVISSSTSSSAIRGRSVSLLYLDEFAFIPKNVFAEFYASVYPTVATSPKAKILMSSTPAGMNHFYKLWMDALGKKNGFAHCEINWDEVPDRNDDFKVKTIAEIGQDRWDQEFDCQFLGSAGTLIKAQSLQGMSIKTPVDVTMDGCFRIYERPQRDRKYIMFCDVSEGVSRDDSTIQVIDITQMPYVQVASFNDNTIRPFSFHEVINKIGTYYNNALVIVENNACGEETLNNLQYEIEYENLFYEKELGLKTSKKTKRLGCTGFKLMIETQQLLLCDFDTVSQLSNFTKDVKGSFSAKQGEKDDLVMPLVQLGYFMTNKKITEVWLDEIGLQAKLNRDKLKQIEDNLLPFGFVDDGHEDYHYE